MTNNNILRSSTPGVPDPLPDGTTKAQAEALGWSETPTTPADNEHTWMTQVFIVDDDYTNCHWSNPVRISGDIGPQGIRGSDGSDGTDFEFIYTRNNGAVGPQGIRGPQAPEAPVYDSNDDPVNTQDDWKGTDNNGVLWTDNPQGVQADLQFEYMVQRKKLSGHQAWEPYEPQTAVVWSKWGENGRDGDGYEYIYRTSSNLITNWDAQGLNNPQNWSSGSGVDRNGNPWDDDEYLGPNGYSTWTDDPVSVDSTTNRYQYVATRKKSGNPAEWHSFSQPALWSQYADPGSVGPEGPQGPQGPAGDSSSLYKLIDMGSTAYVDWNIDENTGDFTETFTLSLNYRVIKNEGTTPVFMTYGELRQFPHQYGSSDGMYAYCRHTKSTGTSAAYYYYKCTLNHSAAAGASQAEKDATIGYFTYTYTSTNANVIDHNNKINIYLIPYNITTSTQFTTDTPVQYSFDKVDLPITVKPRAAYTVTKGDNASIKTLVVGYQGINDQINGPQGIQAHLSTLQQDMNSINALVETWDEDGGVVTYSGLEMTSDEILSQVVRTYNNADGLSTEFELSQLQGWDASKWYPVTISFPWRTYNDEEETYENIGREYRFIVERLLDSAWGVPNYADDDNGFIMKLDFATVGYGDGAGWNYDPDLNRQGEPLYIHKYEVDYTKPVYSSVSGDNISPNAIVGGVFQNREGSFGRRGTGGTFPLDNRNDEVIYLRGGSIYRICTSCDPASVEVYAWPDGYSGTNFSYPVITNWHDLTIPEQDQMTRSEIRQTADAIRLNVFDTIYQQTGIDIESGKISLNANDTSVNGGSMTVNTGSGIIWTDSNGVPKINIHSSDIQGLPGIVTRSITYNSQNVQMINLPYANSGAQRTGTITYEWILETDFSTLGKLPAGATISVSGLRASIGHTSGSMYYLSTSNYVITKGELLYNDSVVTSNQATYSDISSSGSVPGGSWDGTLSTTVTSSQTTGVWKVRVTVNLNNANIFVSYLSGTNFYAKWLNGSYTINFSAASSTYGAIEIGTNGIEFVPGSTARFRYLQNDISINTANYSGIEINSTNKVPVQRYMGGTNYNTATNYWGAFGTQMRVNGSANAVTIANFDYDCYVITSSGYGTITITGDCSYKGRVLYIMCEKSTTISTATGSRTSTGARILDTNGNQQASISVPIGLHTLICYGMNGSNWVWGCSF